MARIVVVPETFYDSINLLLFFIAPIYIIFNILTIMESNQSELSEPGSLQKGGCYCKQSVTVSEFFWEEENPPKCLSENVSGSGGDLPRNNFCMSLLSHILRLLDGKSEKWARPHLHISIQNYFNAPVGEVIEEE